MDEVDERYENGKIYCLSSNNSDLFYLGSTVLSLAKRLQCHENEYRRYQKGTHRSYCSSYDVLATGNYSISLLNEYPCHNKRQLEMEEGYEIEHNLQYAGCVNQYIPGMSVRLGGKNQYMKELWKNTEIITCECDGKYHDCTYERKTHFETKIHKYWIEHGEVLPKRYESIRCGCGGQYTIPGRTRHFESLKHRKYIASQ